MLIVIGVALVLIGAVIEFGGHGISLGDLPGDFKWTRGNTTFYFPLGTSLVLSVLLTILVQLWWRR